jgi:long-chain acyl-CoA synthetase
MTEAQGTSTTLPTGPGDLFELGEEVVDGVTLRVFTNTPASMRDVWAASAAHGDADYIVFEGRRLTYRQAHAAAASLSRRLVGDLGVAPGDRVAIAVRNLPEWVVAFWAATSAGAVVVPLNAWWTGAELTYGLTDSGSTVLVADPERLARLSGMLGDTPVRTVVTVPDGDATGAPDTAPADVVPYEDLVGDADATLPEVAIAPDDDCTIMYTSGTTGRPKGAVGTHRNATASVMNALWVAMGAAAGAAAAGGAGAGPNVPTTLLTLPLFHVGGLHTVLFPYTAAGAKIVLLRRWDAAAALDLIEEERVSVMGGVPTTLFDLLDEAKRQGRRIESLGSVGSGATLVPPELARRIDDQLSSRAAPGNAYGLTETNGVAIYNTGADYLARPESVGKPISPVVEVRLTTADGAPAAEGEVGEVWLKGPTIIRGYHGRPDATAEAIVDGWFRTGDVGRIEDGFLYIVDRLKDVIIRGGENVYAAEVEAALYEHPDVAEAAIIGLPHPRLGEEVAAVVRLRPGAEGTTAESLRAWLSDRLAAFKVPSTFDLTSEPLPRNATGKVLKRDLRASLRPT